MVDAEGSALNLGENKVLISFIPLGLGDVPNRRLKKKGPYPRRRSLCYVDFCSGCIFHRNGKRNLISHADMASEKAGQENLVVVGKHTGGWIVLPLDAQHALATKRGGCDGPRDHILDAQSRAVSGTGRMSQERSNHACKGEESQTAHESAQMWWSRQFHIRAGIVGW